MVLYSIFVNRNTKQAWDFVVDGRYLFEVGGEKKRFTQIKDICESYVVSDNIESERAIAFRFGFLDFSIKS